jgi:hypothetical protein
VRDCYDAWQGVEELAANARTDFKRFNTLRENCLLTFNISRSGGDKREGADVENYFFNGMLSQWLPSPSRPLFPNS